MPRTLYKLLITDLDGTAVPNSPHALPSAAVIEAVKKAQAKIHVSVATGRPFWLCRPILEALNIKDLCSLHGGSQLMNPATQEIVWAQPLGPILFQKICEICKDYQYVPDNGKIEARPKGSPILIGDEDMMALVDLDEAGGQEMLKKLSEIEDLNLIFMHGWSKDKFDLHISHIGASKRHAVEVLMGLLNIEQHEVIAVGDGGNDLPLFEAAGFKVAMGNASDDLKAEADFIADTVDNDGLAQVIKKFIL